MGGSSAAFELDGDDDLGVVLVHGFTGTPFEVGYLGQQLASAGITVEAPRLPGHGTSLEDLDQTRWEDWTAAVDAATSRVAVRCRRVAVVGQSLGGLLALYTASRRPDVACVVSLATPLWLDGIGKYAARWTAPGRFLSRVKHLPKLGGSDVRDPIARRENPCYPAISTPGLAQLMTFMRVVEGALPLVTQPLLVMHATHDHTAPVGCAHHLAARVRSARAQPARVKILPRSYHLIAIDVERDIVAAEVTQFLNPFRGEATACAT